MCKTNQFVINLYLIFIFMCCMSSYMFAVTTANICHFNIECNRGLRSMIFYDELVILECDSRHSLSCYFVPLSESDKAPH